MFVIKSRVADMKNITVRCTFCVYSLPMLEILLVCCTFFFIHGRKRQSCQIFVTKSWVCHYERYYGALHLLFLYVTYAINITVALHLFFIHDRKQMSHQLFVTKI
jgi:hypothetical protein